MRNLAMKMFAACLLAAAAAQGQNADLGLLAGIYAHGHVSTGNGTDISGSAEATFEACFAWQLKQGVVDLYIEAPWAILRTSTGTIIGSTSSFNDSFNFFFTPGLRVKVSPQSRVSFYVAAGGGLGSIGSNQSTAGPSGFVASSSRENTGAFDLGAGADFRLTRLLSIRAEGRDFITHGNIPGDGQTNHGIFVVGIAFHF